MKYLPILAVSLFCLGAVTLQGQPGRAGERIQSMKIAFITNKLQLTPEEAAEFWPVFNQFEADMRKLRQNYQTTEPYLGMTDADAERYLKNSFELEEKELALKKQYFEKMRKILPVRKLAMLSKAERGFKEELVETLQRQREARRNGN